MSKSCESSAADGTKAGFHPSKTAVWMRRGALALPMVAICALLYTHSGTARAGSGPQAAAPAAQGSPGAAVGINWIARKSGISDSLLAIFGSSDGSHLWAAGDAIVESDDGGATWMVRKTHAELNTEFTSVFGTSDGKRVWAVGMGGTILESDNGGKTWAERKSGTTNDLQSITGTSDGGHLWVVGGKGTFLESDDGGATWNLRLRGTKEDMFSIAQTGDGKQLWVAGSSTPLAVSSDNGVTWAAPKASLPTSVALTSLFATSDGQYLLAIGGAGDLLRMDFAGGVWTARYLEVPSYLSSIYGTSDGKRLWVFGSSLQANGVILESDDGGSNWITRSSSAGAWLLSMFGSSDGKHLWVVGNGGVILESDGTN